MQSLHESVLVPQMLQAIGDDDGWTVSYDNDLRVLYKHARSK